MREKAELESSSLKEPVGVPGTRPGSILFKGKVGRKKEKPGAHGVVFKHFACVCRFDVCGVVMTKQPLDKYL